jgi:hypothetical protein
MTPSNRNAPRQKPNPYVPNEPWQLQTASPVGTAVLCEKIKYLCKDPEPRRPDQPSQLPPQRRRRSPPPALCHPSGLPLLRNEQARLLTALAPMRAETGQLAPQRAQAATLQAEVQQLQARRDRLAVTVSEIDRLTAALGQLRGGPLG